MLGACGWQAVKSSGAAAWLARWIGWTTVPSVRSHPPVRHRGFALLVGRTLDGDLSGSMASPDAVLPGLQEASVVPARAWDAAAAGSPASGAGAGAQSTARVLETIRPVRSLMSSRSEPNALRKAVTETESRAPGGSCLPAGTRCSRGPERGPRNQQRTECSQNRRKDCHGRKSCRAFAGPRRRSCAVGCAVQSVWRQHKVPAGTLTRV